MLDDVWSSRFGSAMVAAIFATSVTRIATADETTAPAFDAPAPTLPAAPSAVPPPARSAFIQYGVAFTAELVVAPGALCRDRTIPCVLGSGGGLAVRVGYRSPGPFYFGALYEATKQDPSKLFRLAVLQQARGEARYYFMTGRVTEPYLAAGLGVAGYGNAWDIDTWGPLASLGVGFEHQVTRRTVVGLGVAYRVMGLRGFVDTAGTARDGGISHITALELVLEQREDL